MVSSTERLELIQTLSSLPEAQFKQVVFALDPPKGSLPTETSQGKTAAALLDWVESPTGRGMRTLRGILEDLGIITSAPSGICPYKGLSYFDCNDEDYKYFYGREALTQTLLDRISRDNFLAIVGASGSGKSSVLRAGLLQRLKDKGDSEILILVPGEHPLQSLALAFVDEKLERLDRAEQQQKKAKQLIQTGAEGFCAFVKTSEAQQVILVVDQFEEVFTLCQDEAERQTFFETLLGGLESAGANLYLILAMRSDFVGKCLEQDYGGLADKIQENLLSVRPMTTEKLTQAITEPARRTGVTLELGLTEALLGDLKQSPSGLPLLQYTLTELWKRQQDNQLKLSVYHQLGGVAGTLKQKADEVYKSLTSEQQQTAKHLFLCLTQLGEGAEDTRRRITQASLVSAQHPETQVSEVVKRLADANLVVTDDRGKGAQGEHTATLEVAHEALIRTWPKLRQWLDENRDLLRQQRKIELAAEEWRRQSPKHQKGYLLQGRQLTDARLFQKRYSADLPLAKQAEVFITKSVRERQLTWAKLSSVLLIPLTITYFMVEPAIREGRVQNSIEQIRQKGPGTREAIEYVVRGCSIQRRFSRPAPGWLLEPLFGDCISLASYDLSYANLDRADLRDADLRDADLSSVILNGADLRDADLRLAVLNDALLSYADLRFAQSLTEAQLAQALLCHTTLPDHMTLDPNRDCKGLGLGPETGLPIGL